MKYIQPQIPDFVFLFCRLCFYFAGFSYMSFALSFRSFTLPASLFVFHLPHCLFLLGYEYKNRLDRIEIIWSIR